MQPTAIIGLGSSKIAPLSYIAKQPLQNIDVHFVDTAPTNLIQEGVTFHLIGKRAARGLGCGGNVNLGRKSAEESTDTLWDLIPAKGKVLFLASMAGGTGAGVLPVMLRLAKEKKALATSVITMPFSVEGAQRAKSAESNLKALNGFPHKLIVLEQKHLEPYLPKKTFVNQQEAFNLLNKATAWKVLGEII